LVYFDPFSQAQTRNESVVVLMVATVDRLAGELLASSMARWSHEK
jgi:hypothetical protein